MDLYSFNEEFSEFRLQFERHIQGDHACDFVISDEQGELATGHLSMTNTGFLTTLRVSQLVLSGEDHDEVFVYNSIRSGEQLDTLMNDIATYQVQRSIDELREELSKLDSSSENVSHLVFCVDKLIEARDGSKAKKVRAVGFSLTSALSATLAGAETKESVVTIQEMRIIRDMTVFALSLDDQYRLGVREQIENEVSKG